MPEQLLNPKVIRLLHRVHTTVELSRCYQVGDSHPHDKRTECFDLCALLAELTCDVQRMADSCEGFMREGLELGLTHEEMRAVFGLDLFKLGLAYTSLAKDLSAAGNRALDYFGGKPHG